MSSTQPYHVVAGDTGDAIAKKFNVSLSALEAANPGVNWNLLQVGQSLNIPSSGPQSTTHKVVAGDTGNSIAKQAGISFSQLEAANPSVNWNSLQIGQVINIPGSLQTQPGSPSSPSIPSAGSDAGTDGDTTLHTYSGPASNFPDPSQWQRFSTMWTTDAQIMAINDTPEQIGFIKDAITTVSAESGIDPRVILCVIMQESHGNVHVETSVSPAPDFIRNPGLMQSHNGAEFHDADPQGSILQMVRDGVTGTPDGDGIKQCLEHRGNIYEALREYNSGSVNVDDLSTGVGTPSYVSDIANRLMGAQPN